MHHHFPPKLQKAFLRTYGEGIPMIYFITSNIHKFQEVQNMTTLPIIQKELEYPEIQADTLETVARFGIGYCYERVREPCFLEDSGLFIDALHGFPGPYSRYVFETVGCEGILKLLTTARRAHFEAIIAYTDGSDTKLFMGRTDGMISQQKKGEKGFGFDPIFIPEGETRTFACMTLREKNLYSHRGKAFKNLITYLEKVR
jgi:XTP/dITP diphosphohydrolase